MRIDRISPLASPPAPRRAAAPGFAALLESPGEAAAAEAAQPAALAAGIFAAAADAEAADSRARRHGKAMLQALAALQLAVLGGSEGAARAKLAELAGQAPQADDPVLRLIMREIGVRAAVELARGGTSANVSIG
jgi:hypothetical protein